MVWVNKDFFQNAPNICGIGDEVLVFFSLFLCFSPMSRKLNEASLG